MLWPLLYDIESTTGRIEKINIPLHIECPSHIFRGHVLRLQRGDRSFLPYKMDNQAPVDIMVREKSFLGILDRRISSRQCLFFRLQVLSSLVIKLDISFGVRYLREVA